MSSPSLPTTAAAELDELDQLDDDAEPSRPAPTRGFLYRALAFLGPDYSFFAVFSSILVACMLIFPIHIVWRTYTVELSAGTALAMIAVRFLARAPSIVRNAPGARQRFWSSSRHILTNWGPIFLLALVFANLETYTGLIRTDTIEQHLYDFDIAVFGVEPTVWLSSLNIPILTDWMSIAYGLYIATPMFLAGALYLRKRIDEFRFMTTGVVLQMYIGFALCLILPAGPPRFFGPLVNGGFDPPVLSSFFGIYEAQQASFDAADAVRTRSAFPSLHCSLAMSTLIFAWRYGDAVFPRRRRLFFAICVPLVVSLWISTVYLRHHWMLDIFAGWILGYFAAVMAPKVRRAWPRRQTTADLAPAHAVAAAE